MYHEWKVGDRFSVCGIIEKDRDSDGDWRLRFDGNHCAQFWDNTQLSQAVLIKPAEEAPRIQPEPKRTASMDVIALPDGWGEVNSAFSIYVAGDTGSRTPISRARVTYTEGDGWSIEEVEL